MNTYERLVTKVCLPYALARDSENRILPILDSISDPEMMRRPSTINLKNCGDSCAIDSVLTAVFSHYQLPDTKYETKARRDISDWLKTIENEGSVSKLLPMFKAFPHSEKFHEKGVKDAGAFLMFLFRIFCNDILSTKVFRSIAKNGEVSYSRIDRKSSPIQYISAIDLSKHREMSVLQLLTTTTMVQDSDIYSTREELIQGDLVVFYIGRTLSTGSLVQTSIYPTETLTTPNGDRFFLGSIVACKDGHYVTYIGDRSSWSLVDDLLHKPRIVGSFNQMLRSSPDPKKLGVLYLYFPEYSSVDEYTLSRWQNENDMEIGVFEDLLTSKMDYIQTFFDEVKVDKQLPLISSKISRRPSRGGGVLTVRGVKGYLKNLD